MVTLSSRKMKKAFSHTIDDTVAIMNQMSIVKELRVLVIPNTSFITFHINSISITTMVVPNVETIITLVKSDLHVATVDSQIIIRCDEAMPFHYEIVL